MDVKAIVVVAGAENGTNAVADEVFAGSRIANLDILGKPVVTRIVERLGRFGVSECTVVSDANLPSLPGSNVVVAGENLWPAVQSAFNSFAQSSNGIVFLLRVGPYAEIDFEDLSEFHLRQDGFVTKVVDESGSNLDVYALTAASMDGELALGLPGGWQELRLEASEYVFHGYSNRLLKAVDLRQLAIDAFLQRNEIQPVGDEVRPGIWLAPGARVHPRARIVAPAYVGSFGRVRASAVLTRFAVVEQHAEVDCGTVVENSTLAPYTYVGAGLDVICSLVGLGQIVANLRHGVEVQIHDPKLISAIPADAAFRTFSEAVSLVAYLPAQVFQTLFARSRRRALPAEVCTQSPALAQAPSESGEVGTPEFPSNLAVARRYGNE